MDSSELRYELQKLKDGGQLRANPIIIATVHATRLNAEGNNNIPFILWPSPLMSRGSRWRGFAIFIGTPASDRGVSPHSTIVVSPGANGGKFSLGRGGLAFTISSPACDGSVFRAL